MARLLAAGVGSEAARLLAAAVGLEAADWPAGHLGKADGMLGVSHGGFVVRIGA